MFRTIWDAFGLFLHKAKTVLEANDYNLTKKAMPELREMARTLGIDDGEFSSILENIKLGKAGEPPVMENLDITGRFVLRNKGETIPFLQLSPSLVGQYLMNLVAVKNNLGLKTGRSLIKHIPCEENNELAFIKAFLASLFNKSIPEDISIEIINTNSSLEYDGLLEE